MIKVILLCTLFAILGLFVQSTFFHTLFPTVVAPDFILILVVYLAIRLRSTSGVFIAFFLGILADFASGQYLGPSAGGCALAYSVVYLVAEKLYVERGFALFVLTFLGSLVKTFMFLLLIASYVKGDVFSMEAGWTALIEAGVSALIAMFALSYLDLVLRSGPRAGSSGGGDSRQGWSGRKKSKWAR